MTSESRRHERGAQGLKAGVWLLAAAPSERFPALDFPPALTADVSPVRFASADDPPVLLVHGDQDELVPLVHSQRMHAALQEAGAASELVVIEGAGHGFRGTAQRQARQATVAFFEKHLAEG